MGQRLRQLLPEPRDLNKALWLGAVLFAITCSYTLVKIARDALFLSRLPAGALPLVYLMVGVVTLVVTWIYGKFAHRQSPLRSLIGTAAVSALSLVGFALAFPTEKSWLPMAFYVWVNIYGLILVSQFWAFTNSLTEPREAKRIMGIVGGGGILGGLVGGWAAAGYARRVPLSWFSLCAAGLLIAMVITLTIAVRRGQVERPPGDPEDDEEAASSPLQTPYVRWLAFASICSVMVTGLIDYQFKVAVQATYGDAGSIASFYGRFFIVLNVAALLLQLLGTRWLLQRLGAGPVAAALPAGLAVGCAATLVMPAFRTIMPTRLWDQLMRFSVNKSATEMFYFPLPFQVRRRVKAFIEAGIERFGDALAGFVILGAAWLIDSRPITLSVIALVLIGLWLIAWWNLRAGYVRELGRSIKRMNAADRDAVSLRERGVLKQLVRALDSPYELVVLQALELLEENAAPLVDPRLPKLLAHPSSRVRSRALEILAGEDGMRSAVRIERLTRDPDPWVRFQALRVHAARGDEGTLARFDEYLAAPDPALGRAALAALVEYAGPADRSRVRALLEARIADASPDERRAAAEALAAPRRGTEGFHDLLPKLLDDSDLSVRRAALESAGAAGAIDLVPRLIEALGKRETEPAARHGLVALGESVIDPLAERLADPRVDVEIRRALPPVLSEIPSQRAIDALLQVRGREDVVLAYRTLKAMNHIHAALPNLVIPPEPVLEDLELDIRDRLLAELHLEAQGEPQDLGQSFLVRVLRERHAQALNRVFRRLALLHPGDELLSAYLGVQHADARIRGNAAEFVESLLTAERRALVAPLLPDAPVEERRALASSRFGLEPMTARESLARLLEGDDAWLSTCALYVVEGRRERALLGGVERNLEAADWRVREAASHARLALVGA